MHSFHDMESHYLNIEEFIFDENKIVTYSWLSKSLGIPSNLSKQLLNAFLENNSRISELCVTYLLIGLSKVENCYKALVVKNKDLEEVENSFKSITSKHIYSIHKSLEYSDINVLYAAQKKEQNDTILKGISAIDFNINERNGALLTKLKFNALPEILNQTTGVLKKAYPQLCKKNNVATATNNKRTQGIGAFFNKTTIKLNNVYENAPNEGKPKDTTTGFEVLEKISPSKGNKATLNICHENKDHSQNIETLKEASLKEEGLLKSIKSSNSKLKSASKTSKKVKEKYNKKGPSGKNKKDEKKRKRLVLLSDSESSNTTEDEDDVKRELTPEPQATVIPDNDENDEIISGTPEPSRKRKKKLVSKSYTSDDGYVMTEKQYVEVSCSEGEETAPEKKFKESKSQEDNLANIKDHSKTTYVEHSSQYKNESPKSNNPLSQKTKQASLMSFFKKK